MCKISAYIIAYNEADKVPAAINSVLWADEIVLVDSHSTDGTDRVAAEMGARVVQVPFNGFGDLRNRAMEACRYEWIFSLDTDEQCTPEARDEILSLLAGDPAHDAYLVPRRNYFMGQWIAHSGWYPNYRPPQLLRNGTVRFDASPVHEQYELLTAKPIGHLTQAIWQVPFKNLEEVVKKANRYSTLGATKLVGKRVSMGRAVVHATWAFVKHYVFKKGFLDGWPGFVIAFGNFEGTFYRYAKRYEAQQRWPIPTQPPLRRPAREASS